MYYALNHTHTKSWIYALWVCLCIYTFNLNESDFPHSEQKMAKHFTFQSMVPTMPNTWEVSLCLTFFKAMKSCLFTLLVSELRQLIVLLSSLLLCFILAPLTYFCVIKYGVYVCIRMCGACVYEDQRSTSGTISLHMIHLGLSLFSFI